MKNISLVRCIALIASLTGSTFLHANVEVRFNESAPKDIFSFNNLGQCDLNDVLLEIDLSESAGRLIFDTTASGEGVEVFQPFEVRQGKMVLTSSSKVADGDTTLSVRIDQFKSGETVSFTIDVDDTLLKSELGNIRVSGSEIEGGVVKLQVGSDASQSAVFENKATALLQLPETCAN